jgi:hypothetical protein
MHVPQASPLHLVFARNESSAWFPYFRRMTFPRISLLALACVTFATSLLGDTVVLKDGTKIEGKITSETETQITIETRAGGVIDEQTVKKEDVQSVSKATADEAAYASLRGIKLGASSLPSASQYDSNLSVLKSFVSKYPDSKHKAEVAKLAEEMEAEQKRVMQGEVKLDGKWISAAEVQRERYQINAMIAVSYMKDQAARSDGIGAMNTFELLRKQYPGSRGYIEGVDIAKRLVAGLKQQADARLARLPAENAERQKAIAAAGTDRVQLQNEFNQEKQANEAAVARAKAQSVKWPPFLPRSEELLKQISTLAGEEASQLSSVDVAKARQSLQLANEARAALDAKNLAGAEEKTRAAQEAWGENEIVARLEKEIGDAKTIASTTTTAEAPAETAPAGSTEGKPAETAGTSSETAKESTDSSGSTETSGAEEESNPLFRIVLIVIIAIVAFVGLKAYRGVRKRASEVIE